MSEEEKRSRKVSLLRYLIILFAAAFVLVAVSLLIQMRNSNLTISELSQSSMSALNNAEQLQQANQLLLEENTELQDELDALRVELADTEAQLDEANDQANDYRAERDEQITAGGQTTRAYELLAKAANAYYEKNAEALHEALTELEGLNSVLSNEGQTLYRWLLSEYDLMLAAETTEPETAENG